MTPLLQVSSALVPVLEVAHVKEMSRHARDLALELGLDAGAGDRAAAIVQHAGSNLLQHAGGGEIFVGVTGAGGHRGLQILALDRGRGLPRSVREARGEGRGKSLRGLRAIEQAATTFDVYTAGDGTVLAATIYRKDVTPPLFGGISIAAHGQADCGDGWAVWTAGALASLFVCDGVGVGSEACAATRVAIETFHRQAEASAQHVIESVHDALRGTRGAAVALAELDSRFGTLRYCGLGNITAAVVTPDGARQPLAAVNGIAGQVMRPLHVATAPWTHGSMVVLHSNGLSPKWSLSRYPGLAGRRPDTIAGVLLRDHKQPREDATVVVARNPADA